MKLWTPPALGLCAITLACGCAPMPRAIPIESQAADMLRAGPAFAFSYDAEPVDVGGAGATLTLPECVSLALAHDPRVQSAVARLRRAEADARQTRLLPNPVIGVAVRFPDGGGSSVVDADVSAELLSLLTRPGRISAADGRARAAGAEALTAVLDVVLDVRRQYADVQALAGRAAVEASRRDILRQVADVTDARARAGEAPRLDALTARAALAGIEVDLAQLRSDERVARLALARLIGEPSSAADWALAPWAPPAVAPLSDAAWVAAALDRRPELRAIRWELAALGQEVRLATVEPWAGGAGVSAERDGEWSVGPSASVTLPIFDTGRVAREGREAMVAEQRHELTGTSRRVVEEVRRALELVRSADDALGRTERELVPLQEQKLKLAQDAYRLGMADVVSLRTAEQDFQEARSRVIELQRKRLHARFDLDRATGGPVAPEPPATGPASHPTETK